MDALALLCTLHADGPRTTRRLRQLGVRDLDDLQELAEGDLAEALEASEKGAARFLREAAILKKRVRHEAVEDGPRRRGSARRESGAPAAAEPATPEPGTPDPVPSGSVTSGGDATPAAPGEGDEGLRRYVLHPRVRTLPGPLQVRGAATAPRPAGEQDLRTGLFDALDAAVCERLRLAGIETVEGLARCSGLDLALELAWPYDRVFHLKKEASRFLQSRGAPQFSPAAGPADEGASGPFA